MKFVVFPRTGPKINSTISGIRIVKNKMSQKLNALNGIHSTTR